jgi:hypothetical protein
MLANVAAGFITNASLASAGTTALPAQSAQVAPAQAEATARVAATEQTFLDPAACLLSSWAPFSNTTFVVPQGTVSTQVVVSVTSGTPLDATTAQYTAYTPGGGNSAWANAGSTQLNDFTVIMTATVAVAPPTNGALSSVQFKVSRRNKGQTDPDACSPVHNLFAASRKIYLPLIFRIGGDTQRDITTIEEPNNTTCAAYPIAPGVRYTSRLNDKDDFYRLNIIVTSTLIVTVTGFTQEGQVQVRKFSGACDTGTIYSSTSFQGTPGQTRQFTVGNVVPGDVYIRIASTADIGPNTDYTLVTALTGGTVSTGPFEPNNSACQAAPIALNTTYTAYPEDTNDWYSFTLGTSANVVLSVTNLLVTVGQYSLYKSDNCATIVPGTTTPITTQDKATPTKDVGTQTAGKYFLRVAVGSGAQSTSLYSFRVSTGGVGTWNPRADICPALSNCSANRSGGKFTAYWDGMPGMTEFRIEFVGKLKTGNCPASVGGRVVLVPAANFGTSGSYEVANIGQGYWGIQLSARGSGGSWSRTGDLPLKMDCDFLSANQSDSLAEPEPTAIPEGPEVEATPIP